MVMVVQRNFPQSNTGEKGATVDEIVAFHVIRTKARLRSTPTTASTSSSGPRR